MVALLNCVRVREYFDALIVQPQKAKAQLIEMNRCEWTQGGFLRSLQNLPTTNVALIQVP
jgi:hypothetical protein